MTTKRFFMWIAAVALFAAFAAKTWSAPTNLVFQSQGLTANTNWVLTSPTFPQLLQSNGWSAMTVSLGSNATASAWRAGLGLSEGATNANTVTTVGTAGYVPLYTGTNTIGNSTLYKSGVEYGLDGGLRVGSTSGTAGDNNLVVDGTISVGTTVNTNYSFYAVNKGTNNGSLVLASKAVAVTDGVLLNGYEVFSYDNNITAPGLSTAFMRAYAASSHNGANVGSYLSFGTATDGTTNVLERLRITAGGDVNVKTAGALLTVDSLRVGGTSVVGDNNVGVDGSAYVGGTVHGGSLNITNSASCADLNATSVHATQPTLGNAALTIESEATDDNPIWLIYQARYATTTNDMATAFTMGLDDNSVYTIKACVSARQTSGATNCAGYERILTCKRSGLTVTGVGSQTVVHSAEDDSAWDCTIAMSGTNVLLRVMGAATNSVTWHGNIFVQKLSN